MRYTGLIPMSAKPFHRGHMGMIDIAARTCDSVIILASSSDRIRAGEFPIKGETMLTIWNEHIIKILPHTATVTIVRNPVRAAYEFLGEKDKHPVLTDVYRLYSSKEDLDKNFSIENCTRYMPFLTEKRLIERVPTPRIESGTKMREYLKNDDVEQFMSGLPAQLSVKAAVAIWSTLKNDQ